MKRCRCAASLLAAAALAAGLVTVVPGLFSEVTFIGAASRGVQRPTEALHAQPVRAQSSAPSERTEDAEAWSPGAWLRGTLVALAMLAGVVAGMPRAAMAEGGNVSVYFGQGCFWHVQNELVNQEMNVLGRKGAEISALVGYAGGVEVGQGGEVCYHNRSKAPDYGRMGHTEVVNVTVPEDKVGDIGKVLLDYAAVSTFGRHDPQDMGPEYRSAIGLPGGIKGTAFKQLQKVSNGRLEFVEGQGNDDDTLRSKKVWVYDSDKFPFYQGEIYHQFHDDMLDRYPDSYHKLREEAIKAGTLKKVACPDMKI